MLTGSLALPPPLHTHIQSLPHHARLCFSLPLQYFMPPCSASTKTFTGLLIMCRYEGAVRRPPSQNQTQGIKAPTLDVYVSWCCSICLCYSESIYVALCSSNLGKPSTSIIPHLSELNHSGNHYLELLVLQRRLSLPNSDDKSTHSAPRGTVLPELIKGARLWCLKKGFSVKKVKLLCCALRV